MLHILSTKIGELFIDSKSENLTVSVDVLFIEDGPNLRVFLLFQGYNNIVYLNRLHYVVAFYLQA